MSQLLDVADNQFRKPKFPEIDEIEELVEKAGQYGKVNREAVVDHKGFRFPIYSFRFGSQDPTAPALALVGGVHGLERIGTRVLLSYLKTVCQLLQWDESFHQALERMRLYFYPLVNPAGMCFRSRSNPNGVDLMRNAPVDADSTPFFSLVSGHRISPKLPWYRGLENTDMEIESKALCDFIQRELWQAKVALSLDVHSGYGTVDRIWFPYAKTQKPFPQAAQVYSLASLFNHTYPNHIYKIEPQSRQYTAHGDLWDYLYDSYVGSQVPGLYLPLSLELGSWIWVKKNPRQIFSLVGAFNPILPHRLARTLRRHLILFEFLQRAAISYRRWANLNERETEQLTTKAANLWYGR